MTPRTHDDNVPAAMTDNKDLVKAILKGSQRGGTAVLPLVPVS